MLIYAIYKVKKKGILPVLSLIGLVATISLVLRYTNVKNKGIYRGFEITGYILEK